MFMKVGVDISPLTAHRTGVGTYVFELIHAFARMQSDVEISGYAAGLTPVEAAEVPPTMPYRQLRLPLSVIHKTWRTFQWPSIEKIARGSLDVVHATNFFLPPVESARRVLSVHDISFTSCPEWVDTRVVKPYAEHMMGFCDRADAVLVFSEFTKTEVVSRYGTLPEKVHVTPHGIRQDWCSFDGEQARKIVDRSGIEGPYVLFVGTIEERKNIHGILEAFEQLSDLPHKLVLVGGMGWMSTPFEEIVLNRGLKDRVVLPGYVSADTLPAFYKAADAFVFPSLYEGFGFPVLEAFSSDCPVITSNQTSLPGVGGDAVKYVDPMNPEELAEAIRSVVTDAELAGEMREKGRARVKEFTWDRTAQMTLDVYRSVLN